ncbi:MAG: flavodoxin family protein [Fusobacterium necrophorum]|nr:flavodoxin family protein [Fusobacterium necrophorum]MDY2572776.1 flavodoxin family protein [Fusobacterium necrophorum]MDY6173009.1 flavodoxin family protein [Fusobacterium necrophorum]
MKTVIIYSSLTGNTKKVCEVAFKHLQQEKQLIQVEEKDTVDWTKVENVIIGYWVDKGTADAKTRKFLSKLQNKNLYFIGTLGESPTSFHGEKCIRNVTKLCEKNNHFKGGILVRGKVSEDLKQKMDKFPLNIVHKFVPNMKQIVLDAEGHPNEEDFQRVIEFIEKNVNPNL